MEYLFSDSGQAEAACREALPGRFRHVHGIGWIAYDGRRWKSVPDKVPLRALREWTGRRLIDGAAGERKDWVRRLDDSKLAHALHLAEGFEGITADPEDLDANPDILNCRNGVVYLPTGDLTPHNPDLLLTKCTGVDYEPAALHEDWTAALRAVPAAVEGWLQSHYGQGITGHMAADDKVLIQQGGGSNGKSTVLAGVAAALGDYYLMASDKILMSGQMGAHTTDFADLMGARFVAVEETPEAGRLDVVRLKKVAGTERITARKLYRDNYSFKASHTLFVNSNYPPAVAETDEGTWRRLALVVFPYHFCATPTGELDRAGDPRLRERMADPDVRKAVLAWLIEGASRWYAAGRAHPAVPEVVENDTGEWRGRSDHVGNFWAEFLQPSVDHAVWNGDMVWLFNQYLRNQGNSPVAESTFARRFGHHPTTAGHMVSLTRIRQEQSPLQVSRPFGALDPHTRLPGMPTGQIRAWTGVKVRRAVADPSDLQERWGESGESSGN